MKDIVVSIQRPRNVERERHEDRERRTQRLLEAASGVPFPAEFAHDAVLFLDERITPMLISRGLASRYIADVVHDVDGWAAHVASLPARCVPIIILVDGFVAYAGVEVLPVAKGGES